jgi:hypothetical protein
MLPLARRTWFVACAWCMGTILAGCGGKDVTPTPPTTPTPTMLTSSFTAATISQPVATATLNAGWTMSPCTLHAGSNVMNWTATSASTWLTVIPPSGTLPANSTTSVAAHVMSTQALPLPSTGGIIISAAGYVDNTGMRVTVAANTSSSDIVTVTCQ